MNRAESCEGIGRIVFDKRVVVAPLRLLEAEHKKDASNCES